VKVSFSTETQQHTFGRRVRAAGWSNEDRKDLLGHKNGDITTLYSRVEIDHLREVVESITGKISYVEGCRSVGRDAKSLKNGGYALI
jgi:hypothetical protein